MATTALGGRTATARPKSKRRSLRVRGETRTVLRRRAYFWYERAQEAGLEGATKAKVDGLVKKLETTVPATRGPWDHVNIKGGKTRSTPACIRASAVNDRIVLWMRRRLRTKPAMRSNRSARLPPA